MNAQQTGNAFLQSLSPSDFELLRPELRAMRLDHGQILFDIGGDIEHVFFPESGVISTVVPINDGDAVEAGMTGRDGVVGASAALDGGEALNRAIVQVSGSGLTLGAGPARAAIRSSETLRADFYRSDQLMLAQAQQSAVCNAKHQLEERLCRWLLRTLDLIQEDDLPLTQEFLSQMLGVRRTSVTLAASRLQSAGIIEYRRGHIRMLDRDQMQECACECYQAVKEQARRLQGQTRNRP
jgi:CRP-like cAMP-binding protein